MIKHFSVTVNPDTVEDYVTKRAQREGRPIVAFEVYDAPTSVFSNRYGSMIGPYVVGEPDAVAEYLEARGYQDFSLQYEDGPQEDDEAEQKALEEQMEEDVANGTWVPDPADLTDPPQYSLVGADGKAFAVVTLRQYLLANMFPGDDERARVTYDSIGALMDEIVEHVALWTIHATGAQAAVDRYYGQGV